MQILQFASTSMFALMLLVTSCVGPPSSGSSKRAELHTGVNRTVNTFKSRDPSISKFFGSSAGYAVYPSVGKGGLIFAGAHGDGEVFEGGKLIGTSAISKGSVGLQAGGQVFEQIVFFKDRYAMNRFKNGTLAFDAGVSAVIVETGGAAKLSYRSGVAVFVRSRAGAMVEASVGGQVLSFVPE